MHSQRNRWLAGLSKEEFEALSAWDFINHAESRQQWIAEVRSKLTTQLTNLEILSSLYLGLYNTVSKAITRHSGIEPSRRAFIVIGSALSFIRTEGVPAIYKEITGHVHGLPTISIEACLDAQRSHGLEHRYYSANSDYIESLPVAPQFLADEQAVPDLLFQERHFLCESIKHHLTPRETQVIRLMVIDTLDATDISEMLNVSKRQVWKVQREIRIKLLEISKDAGVCQRQIDRFSTLLQTAGNR